MKLFALAIGTAGLKHALVAFTTDESLAAYKLVTTSV